MTCEREETRTYREWREKKWRDDKEKKQHSAMKVFFVSDSLPVSRGEREGEGERVTATAFTHFYSLLNYLLSFSGVSTGSSGF